MIEQRDLRVIFETVSGSHLYGTAIPTSDLDLRGVGIASFRYALGIERFDQLESKSPDRTIFALQKFVVLAADANLNIIELLFAPRKHWRTSSRAWETLLENVDLFLSRKVRHTFAGYAFSQLHRIKNHKHWIDNPPEKPDRAAMGLSIESSVQEDALKALATVPKTIIGGLSDTVQLEKEYATRMKEWQAYKAWKDGRNADRFALESQHGYDTKHAMHLVRLMRMGVELLTMGTTYVDRTEVDADELIRIRHGEWEYERLIEYAESMDKKMDEAYATTGLQDKPDRKKINELLLSILCDFFGIDVRSVDARFASM